jgi:hypothetical protein
MLVLRANIAPMVWYLVIVQLDTSVIMEIIVQILHGLLGVILVAATVPRVTIA